MTTAIATGEGNPPAETFDPEGITSPEDAFALLRGGQDAAPTEAPAATAEAPTEAESAATETETAPEGETPPETAPETGDDDEPQTVKPGELPKFRYRPKDFQEAEVMRLIKSGVKMPEAVNRVYGTAEPKPATTTPPEANAPAADSFAADEAKLTAEITALEKEAEDVAEKAGEDVDVKTAMKQSIRLATAIASKRMAIERIANRREAAAHEAESERQVQVQTKEQADFSAVVAKYPALGKKDSPERSRFETFLKTKSDDPEYAPIFNSSRWRSILAREFADEAGIAPTSATTPASTAPSTTRPPAAQVAPRPPNGSQVLTTRGASPPASTFATTPEQVAREIETLDDPEVAMAILRGDAAPPPGKRRK